MKHYAFLLASIGLLFTLTIAHAEGSDESKKVATTFPGVEYRIGFLKRLAPDRLLLGVQVAPTLSIPPNGTLIGFPVPIPKDANPLDVAAGYYRPRPLSLMSSQMTDDITHQIYPVLNPIGQNGMTFRPSTVLGTVTPRRSYFLTIQFQIPPPPIVVPGQPPPIPTVSFMLTNATGPISKVPIPPPLPTTPTPK